MKRLYTALLASVIALASVTNCKPKDESKLERTVAAQRIITAFDEIQRKHGMEDVSSAMKKFEESWIRGGYSKKFTGVAKLYESLSRFNFDDKTKEKIDLIVLAGLHTHSNFGVLRYIQLLQVPEYHGALTHEKMIDVMKDVFAGSALGKLTKAEPIKSLGKIGTFLDYLELEDTHSEARYFDKKDHLSYMEIIERNPEIKGFLTKEGTIRQLVRLSQADDKRSRWRLPSSRYGYSCGEHPIFDDVTERYLKLLIEDKGSRPLLANVSVLKGLADIYGGLKEEVSLTKEARVSVLEKGLSGYDPNTRKLMKKCLCWNKDIADYL